MPQRMSIPKDYTNSQCKIVELFYRLEMINTSAEYKRLRNCELYYFRNRHLIYYKQETSKHSKKKSPITIGLKLKLRNMD